jgi:hypothetical protein
VSRLELFIGVLDGEVDERVEEVGAFDALIGLGFEEGDEFGVVLGVGAVVLVEEVEGCVLGVHEDQVGLGLVFVDCLETRHYVVVVDWHLDHSVCCWFLIMIFYLNSNASYPSISLI